MIDTVDFAAQLPGVSRTAKRASYDSRARRRRTAANYPPLTNVVINEVLAHTDPPLKDAVELFNPTSQSVDISGWFLSNTGKSLKKFRIPNGT